MKMQGQRPREDGAGNSPTLGSPCHLPPQNPGVSRGGRPTQLQLPHGPGQSGRPAGPECEPDPTRPRGWGEWQSGVSWEPRGGPWKGTAGAQGDIESLAQAPVADPQCPAWGTMNCSVRSGPTSPLASRVGESEGARGPRAWVGSRGAWTVQVSEGGHGGGVPRPGRWWPSTPGVRVTEAARGSCASEWHCCRAGRAWPTCAGGQGLPRFTPAATQEAPFSPGGQLQREGKEWGAGVAECGASAWARPLPGLPGWPWAGGGPGGSAIANPAPWRRDPRLGAARAAAHPAARPWNVAPGLEAPRCPLTAPHGSPRCFASTSA